MDQLFREFGRAVDEGNGNALAATLAPVAADDDLYRLWNIWNGAGAHDTKAAIKRKIQHNTDALSHGEVLGWTDVYFAFWQAIGQILAAEGSDSGQTVGVHGGRTTCGHDEL